MDRPEQNLNQRRGLRMTLVNLQNNQLPMLSQADIERTKYTEHTIPKTSFFLTADTAIHNRIVSTQSQPPHYHRLTLVIVLDTFVYFIY